MDINQLNKEIIRLNNKISQLKKENDKALNKLRREQVAELRRLQNEMAKENEANRRKLEKEYEAQLRKYKMTVKGELTQMDKDMREEIHKRDILIQQYKREIRNFEEQLKHEVEQIRHHLRQSALNKQSIAQKYVEEFKNVLADFVNIPHQKFKPGKLKQISKVETEFDPLDVSEMYEAEAAVAISGTTSLHRFAYEIDEDVHEWVKNYEVYKTYVQQLYGFIVHDISAWQCDYAHSVHHQAQDDFYHDMFDDNENDIITEINFYSFDQYRNSYESLLDHIHTIKDIEDMGIDQYLMKEDSLSLASLVTFCDDLHEILMHLSDIYYKAKSCQSVSKERSEKMTSIIHQFMHERNTSLVKLLSAKTSHDAGRDYVDYKVLAKKLSGDPRRALHAVLDAGSDVYIHIFIRPEDMGSYYRNDIVLYDDLGENTRHYMSIEKDDYDLLISFLANDGVLIDLNGYEENDGWFVPFLNENTISIFSNSKDPEVKKFAGKLQQTVNNRM